MKIADSFALFVIMLFTAVLSAQEAKSAQTAAAPAKTAPVAAPTPATPAPAAAPAPAVKTVKPLLTRHGFLYSAEISKKKPSFQHEVKEDQPEFPNLVWAEIILKLPKSRGISRFDYELKTQSGSYPCLAVALENEAYSQKREHWTIEAKKENDGKFVRLLFAFPAFDLQSGAPLQTLTLDFKLADTGCPVPPIAFRILPDGQPLSGDPQKLGENGNYGLSWQELQDVEKAKATASAPAEEKKPAPAASPAAPAEAKPAQAAPAPNGKK